MINEPLQEWANNHIPADNLLWKQGYWDQICFVRDRIAWILSDGKTASHVSVISTHSSKSVTLPVFMVRSLDGTRFIMRYNFYDWKVSVDSPVDVDVDFFDLFKPTDKINSCYCEGFPEHLVHGSYAQNKRQFTIELNDNYCLFVFFFLWTRRKTT